MNTTHIGSLPFKSIEEAISFNQNLTLPALPTLPNLDPNEFMINQFEGFYHNASHELSFKCLKAFLKEFPNRKVKIQVCGIQTLANSFNEKIEIEKFKNKFKGVVLNLLDKISSDIVLFFDEPDLRNLDPNLWSVYKEFLGLELGIHCCANISWSHLDLNCFKNISFDSSLVSEEDLVYLRSLDKVLFWGNIDTMSAKVRPRHYLYQEIDYITPSCGLSYSSEGLTNEILRSLTDT